MKIINVVGHESLDIVLYLAAILNGLGEKVAVTDRTDRHEMSDYLPHVQGLQNADAIELRGVSYARKYECIPPDSTYCFNVFSARELVTEGREVHIEEECGNASEWIFITDEFARHARDTQAVYEYVREREQENKRAGTRGYLRVIRGCTGVTLDSYEGLLDGCSANLFRVPYIERDCKAKLHLSVREDSSFRPLSERLSSVLEKMTYVLRPGTKVAEFERAFTSMLKGGRR